MMRTERSPYEETPEPLVAAACPTCGGVVSIAAPAIGMRLECPDCDELLEITEMEPLALAIASDPDVIGYPDEDEHREV